MFLFLMPLMLHIVPSGPSTEVVEADSNHPLFTQGRQTTWSGTQTLSGTYTIGVPMKSSSSRTVVRLAANERLVVDGRLTVLGTQLCPVVFEASGLGDHEGIQFNTSSSGRGLRFKT